MPFSLKLRGLPDAEVRLIKTIVRLSDSLKARWTVRDDGPCDVEFRDSSIHEDAEERRYGKAGTIVKVAQHGETNPAFEIQRPLRAEKLIEILNRAQDLDGDGDGDTPAPPAQGRPALPRGRVKLKSWPGAGLLGGRAERTKMATRLLHRSVTCDEFMRKSGAPADCEAFLQDLAAAGLLVEDGPGAAESPAASTASAAPAAAPAAPKPAAAVQAVEGGIIARIRRRLGLG